MGVALASGGVWRTQSTFRGLIAVVGVRRYARTRFKDHVAPRFRPPHRQPAPTMVTAIPVLRALPHGLLLHTSGTGHHRAIPGSVSMPGAVASRDGVRSARSLARSRGHRLSLCGGGWLDSPSMALLYAGRLHVDNISTQCRSTILRRPLGHACTGRWLLSRSTTHDGAFMCTVRTAHIDFPSPQLFASTIRTSLLLT